MSLRNITYNFMMQEPTVISEHVHEEKSSRSVSFSLSLLALLLALQISGGLAVISQINRYLLWFVWILMWSLIFKNGFNLNTVPSSARLFLVWLTLYCAWGLIVSPFPEWNQAVRSLFYAFTAAAALAILSCNHSSWKRLSFFSGLGIIINLAVSLALINISGVQDWMFAHNIASAEFQSSINRYAGFFGDANEAGLQTILLLVLTSWSSGWIVWISRTAAVWFIYLTASRTSTYCLLLVGGIYLFYYIGYTRRKRLVAIVLVCLLFLGIIAEIDPMSWFHKYETDSLFWTRILDPLEHQSRSHYTRFYLTKLWLRYIDHAPWYGYGLNAMRGGASPYAVFRTDIPSAGTHNMFLGVWADAGLPGLISYLALLTLGIIAAIRADLGPLERTAVLCIWNILFVFNMFLEALHFGMHSVSLYLLAFMLPALPIFQAHVETKGNESLDTPGTVL